MRHRARGLPGHQGRRSDPGLRGPRSSALTVLSKPEAILQAGKQEKNGETVFIGVGRYELFIPASTSLKDKRQILRSVTQNVQNKLHLSIAEVDYQDKWQRAGLGVSCVSTSASHCREVLQEVEKVISRAAIGGAEISDREIAVVSLEDIR